MDIKTDRDQQRVAISGCTPLGARRFATAFLEVAIQRARGDGIGGPLVVKSLGPDEETVGQSVMVLVPDSRGEPPASSPASGAVMVPVVGVSVSALAAWLKSPVVFNSQVSFEQDSLRLEPIEPGAGG